MYFDPNAEGLTVAQMSCTVGVTAHTLRYWERAGLIAPIQRDSAGRRVYRQADVVWVQFLLRLRETGMPIARMREYARLRAQGDMTIPERLDLLSAHQHTLRQQIEHLQEHQNALDAKIDTYRHMLSQNRDPQ